MKIFLDSANLDEINQAVALGIVDGVTTNPALIAQEGVAMEDQIRRICSLVDGDVSAEVVSTTTSEMIRDAHRLAAVHRNVVVKIPLVKEGIAAVSVLSKEGIRTNVTLCFSPAQALLAAKAGAYIVSPFVGRLEDLGSPGLDLVRDIVQIYTTHGYKTQVLAASLRGARHVVEVAKLGAHIATVPLRILDQMFYHPLTEKGLEQFLAEYHKTFDLVRA